MHGTSRTCKEITFGRRWQLFHNGVSMDIKEQDLLGDHPERHWYYAAKSAALLQMLGGRTSNEVLDVGAGSGFFSRCLLDAGVCNRATCVDTGYSGDHSETHGARPIDFVRNVPVVTQKLVLMMDVLEHVDDDVGLIRAYTDGMPVDGLLVITVPAFQFLWSGHDVFLEHKRRYTLNQLQNAVERAGLEVVKGRYFFSALFPVIYAVRLWQRLRLSSGQIEPRSDLRSYPAVINAALRYIHAVERATIFRFNRFAGLTIFCVARKRA
jgi:hypothetical protein